MSVQTYVLELKKQVTSITGSLINAPHYDVSFDETEITGTIKGIYYDDSDDYNKISASWNQNGSKVAPSARITLRSLASTSLYMPVYFYTVDNNNNFKEIFIIKFYIYNVNHSISPITTYAPTVAEPNENMILTPCYFYSTLGSSVPKIRGNIHLITIDKINNGFIINSELQTSTYNTYDYEINLNPVENPISINADIKNSYKITGSYDSGCSISNVPVTVAEGESVYIDVTKKQGYKITSVLVDGVSQSLPSQTAGSGTVLTIPFTNVTSNHTITAVSSLYTYTISTSAGSGGSISSSITAQYGKSYTVNITPNTGYETSDVTIDGTSVGKQSSYIFNNVIANHTVYATFSKIPETKYNVYVTTVDNGNIVVSPSVATAGTKISISVNPSTGYQLKQITSEPSVVISNNSFTMPESNITLTAEFESVVIPNYTITIGTSLYGSAVANYDTASAGTVITLTATPSTGYYLKGYNSQPFVSILNGQFIMPSNDVTVTPVFDKEDIEKTSYDIYIKSESSTMGDVSVTGIDESKGLITLKAEPEIGYSFSEWEISDGVCYLSSPFTAETIMIIQDSDVSVIAHFVKDELPSRVNQVHLTITK